jgi:hypothetical protein
MAQTETVNYARPEPTVTKTPLSRDLAAGALSGEIAGLIMAVAMMLVFALFLGKSLLYPVQVIGATVYGDAALVGTHGGAVLLGLLLHQLGPSLFWGLVFGALVHWLEIRNGTRLIVLGAAVGLLAQIIDVNFLVPAVFRAAHGHNIWAEQVPNTWSLIAHLVYGVSLGVFPWVYNRLHIPAEAKR